MVEGQKIMLAFCLFFLVGSGIAAGQETATGTVFLDKNINGALDEGEPGIAEVPVSNGEDVVLTDQSGQYELNVDSEEDQIFVIKPAGYQLPTDSLNRVQFYYLHKPNGSPDLEFEGVAPTGKLPESVDFPLLPGEQKDAFDVLLFGDPQPYNLKEIDYFNRDIISELVNTDDYSFGISLGDLVGDNLDLFLPYSEAVARIGLPWHNVYGNHDMNFDAKTDHHADETYEAHFGPTTYAFNHGQTHFIILDDVIYPRAGDKSGYIGGFTDEQLEFVKNDLEHVPEDHLVVLAFHIPIHQPGNRNTFREEDRRRMFELLDDYPHTLSLSAHTHRQNIHFFGHDRGWGRPEPHIHYNVGTTSGDWWSGEPDERGIPPTIMRDGTPNGYAALDIDGNSFTFDYKAADKPKDYRMSIWGPSIVPQNSWHRTELFVNYFLGSDYTKVDYRIKGETGWRSMNKVRMEDPRVARLRTKWDTADTLLKGARPSNPVKSNHLWKSGIPTHLPLGKHTVEIRIRDIFGRTFTDTYSYRVVKPKH